ncbi:metallopeptidase family protein [Bombiscardovia coagulans]|uniref:Peptidase n=1 Tax=Bombiscardovia coagulans TaxID=686666 RepID=A0A261ET37_9BIFI|nr:metallopeptidase family protein [Bombiscardovia coagulans]OZG50020.1 hypothetical protein BOCO_0537 [Bombiscardovia coagulans]
MKSTPLPWQEATYRNLHGRGIRRPTFGTHLPRSRTRAGIFDAIVAAQMKRLEAAWPQLIRPVQFAVEDTPPSDPLPWDAEPYPLSRSFPASRNIPARIVLYRLPIQHKTHSRLELQIIIRDEIVQSLAELYGKHPEDIDPSYKF